MDSKVNSQQAQVQWLSEITKAKLNPFLFPSFYLNNGKRGEKGNLDKFGQFRACLGNLRQFWAIQGKLGQGNNLEKWGKGKKNKKRKQQMGKGNKNLSGDGEEGEEGGESRVLNSPKAFGELITLAN